MALARQLSSKYQSFSLSKLDVDKADMKSVEAHATNFICAAYGNKIVYFYVRMQCIGLKGGIQKKEEWCVIIKKSARFHQPVMYSSKCTQRISASCSMQQFKSRGQICTQQITSS